LARKKAVSKKTKRITKKPKTIVQLKKILDAVFSEYIRLRAAKVGGDVTCFTCGDTEYFRKMQCGHFQSRRYLKTRWDEQNCQVQCPKCNIFNQGEQYIFGTSLDLLYGKGTAIGLYTKSRELKRFSRDELEKLIEHYDKIVEKLKKDLNVL
jgi:hypothetical protein